MRCSDSPEMPDTSSGAASFTIGMPSSCASRTRHDTRSMNTTAKFTAARPIRNRHSEGGKSGSEVLRRWRWREASCRSRAGRAAAGPPEDSRRAARTATRGACAAAVCTAPAAAQPVPLVCGSISQTLCSLQVSGNELRAYVQHAVEARDVRERDARRTQRRCAQFDERRFQVFRFNFGAV